jgi:hypothetical protein
VERRLDPDLDVVVVDENGKVELFVHWGLLYPRRLQKKHFPENLF